MSFLASLTKNLSPNSVQRDRDCNEVQSCPDLPRDAKKHVGRPVTPLDLGAGTSDTYSNAEAEECLTYTLPRHSKQHSSDAERLAETSQCHFLVEKILETVGALESTLVEDHKQEFQLSVQLERKTEEVRFLSSSLEAERKRNQRLIQLIQRGDNAFVSENDTERYPENSESTICADSGNAMRSSANGYDCISPMLMQQRYEELHSSYQHCRRQLAKKEKTVLQIICEKEESETKYETLFETFRNLQKSLEDMCGKYLRFQIKKHGQIEQLRDALNCAGDCILIAQKGLERCDCIDDKTDKKFQRNIKIFLKALRQCDWIQHGLADEDTSVASSK